MTMVRHCDEVFEVLTRGPFPAGGADDSAVEMHLRACHSCRCLAEALRPAVDLFHESLADTSLADESLPPDRRQLPVYLGRVEQVLHRDVRGPSGVSYRGARDAVTGQSAHAVAGAVLGFAASVVIWLAAGFGGPRGADQPSVAAAWQAGRADRQVATLDGDGRVVLASLGVPLSCLPATRRNDTRIPGPAETHDSRFTLAEAGGQLADGRTLEDVLCCTRCHFAGGPALRSRLALDKLTTACAACHGNASRELGKLSQRAGKGAPRLGC